MTKKIVVLNSKGGCGKTTLSTNLASYYAANGYPTALLDYDPQDSATRWLRQRPEDRPGIHGIAAGHSPGASVTRSFQMRIPPGTERIILDTPASLKRMDMIDILRGAAAIVIPMLPSAIDSYVTVAFIRELGSMSRTYAPAAPFAIVANRVRRNTRALSSLMEFLGRFDMQPVALLRDTQNYVHAAETGLGIHEMNRHQTRVDREQWNPLVEWLETVHSEHTPMSAVSAIEPCMPKPAFA